MPPCQWAGLLRRYTPRKDDQMISLKRITLIFGVSGNLSVHHDHVGGDGGVRMADMGDIVDVIDRGRDEEFFTVFLHWAGFWFQD